MGVGLRVLVLLLTCATGVGAFTVTTSNANVEVKENAGADLTCSHSADFGANARVEWKFNDMKGSQTYVILDRKPTSHYAGRVTMFDGNVRFNKVTRKDNGEYTCDVSGSSMYGDVTIKLTALVPPSPPVCRIPASVTTGRMTTLSCHDGDASPPPTYKWYKDNTLLPENPKQFLAFQNTTYKIDTLKGDLEISAPSKMDSASYFCEATNKAGPPQRCKAVKMQVRDVNTGGIVAGVIVALLLVAMLALGIWYAHKKGYLPKKSDSKPKPSVIYQPPSLYAGEDEDGEFRQKSSFVV